MTHITVDVGTKAALEVHLYAGRTAHIDADALGLITINHHIGALFRMRDTRRLVRINAGVIHSLPQPEVEALLPAWASSDEDAAWAEASASVDAEYPAERGAI